MAYSKERRLEVLAAAAKGMGTSAIALKFDCVVNRGCGVSSRSIASRARLARPRRDNVFRIGTQSVIVFGS